MTKNESEFVDITKDVDDLLKDPENTQYADALSARMRTADKAHAMSLAMLRKASALTQADLAAAMQVTQSSVARQEGRSDMLLSTLHSYLQAAGAELEIMVTLANGQSYTLAIDDAEAPPTNASERKPANSQVA